MLESWDWGFSMIEPTRPLCPSYRGTVQGLGISLWISCVLGGPCPLSDWFIATRPPRAYPARFARASFARRKERLMVFNDAHEALCAVVEPFLGGCEEEFCA